MIRLAGWILSRVGFRLIRIREVREAGTDEGCWLLVEPGRDRWIVTR